MDGSGVLEEVLRATLSANNGIRKAAETRLESLRSRKGFLLNILQICGNQKAPEFIRTNRQQPPDSKVVDTEKTQIKQALLTFLAKQGLPSKVEKQLLVAIGAAARIEWPRDWGNLFPRIGAVITGDGSLFRGLCILEAVLEDLATLRMHGPRIERAKACQNILTSLDRMWFTHVKLLVSHYGHLKQQKQPDNNSIKLFTGTTRVALVIIKCFRLLMVYGTVPPFPFSTSQAKMLSRVLELLKVAPMIRANLPKGTEMFSNLSSLCVMLVRTLCECAEFHPLAFVKYSRQFLPFFGRAIAESKNQNATTIFEDFSVYCIRFMREMFKCPYYSINPPKPRVPYGVDPSKIEFDANEATEVRNTLKSMVKGLAELLVTHLMPMNSKDLQQWKEEPEKFFLTSHRLHQYECLRPASEALFWDLLKGHKDVVVPLVTNMLRHTLKMPPFAHTGSGVRAGASKLRECLFKDSLYNALGVASYELVESFGSDFSIVSWFKSILKKELAPEEKAASFETRILQRRVVGLLGEFSSAFSQTPDDVRKDVYMSIIRLMGSSKDLVVRFTALLSLKSFMDCCQAYEFQKNFGALLSPICRLALQLTSDCEETSAKLQVFSMLQFVFARAGRQVKSIVHPVVKFIPNIWSSAERQNVVRLHILQTLASLVNAGGPPVAACIVGFTSRMISWCVEDGKGDDRGYLHESAMDLWLAVVKNTAANAVSSVSTLDKLFNICWPSLATADIIDLSTDYVSSCLQLASAHFLLLIAFNKGTNKGECFGSGRVSDALSNVWQCIIKSEKSHKKTGNLLALDSLILDLSLILPTNTYFGLFHGYLEYLIIEIMAVQQQQEQKSRHDSQSSQPFGKYNRSRMARTCGGMSQSHPTNNLVLCNHLHVIARSFCISWDTMMLSIKKLSQSRNEELPVIIGSVLSVWTQIILKVMLSRSSLSRCKLSAVTLCNFLLMVKQGQVGVNLARTHFNNILNCIIAIIDNEDRRPSSLVSEEEKLEKSCADTKRKESLERKDVCVNVDLRKYLLAKLEQASQSLGKQRFNDILQKFVDAKVLQKVKQYSMG